MGWTLDTYGPRIDAIETLVGLDPELPFGLLVLDACVPGILIHGARVYHS